MATGIQGNVLASVRSFPSAPRSSCRTRGIPASSVKPGRELAVPVLELAVVRVLRPASEESGKAAEVDLVSGSVVDPVAELVESAERGASPPSTTDSATSQSSLLYTGSQPYSCTAAVVAFVGP